MASLAPQTRLYTTLETGGIMQPLPERDVARLETFPRVTPVRLCRSPQLRARLMDADANVIHHHALWLLTLRYAREAAVQRGVPLVISPRGMLSDWAYAHHAWRKRFAAAFVHPGALNGAAGWHATSAAEADEIRARGFGQPICVAPNGVAIPSAEELAAARAHWATAVPPVADRRVALFYSRFHRKKRLRELVELWQKESRGDWMLLIVGVPEEFSVAEIQSWIQPAARDSMMVFDGRGHPPPYAAASLFVLPTHSENFGLVVAESLAAGVPVLTTDGAPWQELHANDAGWCVPWTEFEKTLRAALGEPAAALGRRGALGRAWVARDFTWESSARTLLAFYATLQSSR